jgi:hypothetical protein
MEEAMKAKPDLLGVVELREPRGCQPAGAIGAVAELFPTEALVEIADEHGRTAQLLTVPYEALRIQESSQPLAAPPDNPPATAATHRDTSGGTFALGVSAPGVAVALLTAASPGGGSTYACRKTVAFP